MKNRIIHLLALAAFLGLHIWRRFAKPRPREHKDRPPPPRATHN